MAAGTPGIINWQISPVGTATVKPASDPVMLPVAVSDSWPTIAVSSGYQIKNYSLNGKDYTEAELKALTLSESNATNYEVSTGEYLFTIIVNIVSAGEKKYVSDKGLEHFYENLKKGCPFPVGYGGFFQTDPNTIYAGTAWEQKKDVFILAAGDKYAAGSTGRTDQPVTAVKNGVYIESDGEYYYYKNGQKNYGGLLKFEGTYKFTKADGSKLTLTAAEDGDYYYACTKGNLSNASGYVSKTNGLLPEGNYDFDSTTRKMVRDAGSTGGGEPNNNMPPYFAMPFWIRTA